MHLIQPAELYQEVVAADVFLRLQLYLLMKVLRRHWEGE